MNWYERVMMEIEASRNSEPQGCAIPAAMFVLVVVLVAALI